MSTRSLLALTLALVGVPLANPLAADPPALGKPASDVEVRGVDLTVMPDGSGLPSGSGGVATGADVYRRHCQACHGQEGQGGSNDQLAGGAGSLTGSRPVRTIGSYWPYATTIFDYVRRAMPYPTPGVLSDDEVYAVTAYLLYLNGIVAEDAVLDARTLPEVVMPNRSGFTSALD